MSGAGEVVYRLLLRALPAAVRRERGPELLGLYRTQRAEFAGRPLAGTVWWCRMAVDVVWQSVLERLSVPPSVTEQSWSDLMTHARARDTATHGRIRRASWPSGFRQDARQAIRRLLAMPGFTLVAVATLALGVGANTAIFSVVYGVVFQPLPFPDSSRLVGVFQIWDGKRDEFSAPNFLDVQGRTKTLASSAAYDTNHVVLTGDGAPETLVAGRVTAGFFDTLRVPAAIGRVLMRPDNDTGRTGVVVLSDALWRERFGADPAILNRTLTLDAQPYRVVGVMPRGFVWPLDTQLWMPFEYTPSFTHTSRGAWYLSAVGRLEPGVTVAQAAGEFAGLARQLERENPKDDAKVGETVDPLLDALVGDTRRALLILSAVAFVLLIACANVANLMLARASARAEEFAVRTALGAGRWQLVRPLLVESLVLAAFGGAAGVGCAALGLRALLALRPGGIPRLDNIGINTPVLVFALGAAILTGLLFGLLPALHVTGLADRLRERGRSGTAGRRSHRLRGALVIAEIALAMMLLAGAGLLVRSFMRLSRVDPGFMVGHAAVFNVGLPDVRYKEDAARIAFYDRLHDRIAHLPGVTGVGSVLAVPPTSPVFNLSFSVKGWPPPAPGSEPVMEVRLADEHYFQTMGIPVVRGRGFTAEDRQGSPQVVLLTASAARKFFPAGDALGQHIDLGWHRNGQTVGGDVVGIVADVKSFGLDQASPPQVYLPFRQVPMTSMAYVVRTSGDETTIFSSIRQATAAIDGDVPVNRLETLQQHVNKSIAEQRFYMILLAIFAAVALALSAVGIFGVLSYLVAQRRREIGIRVALGAQGASVVGLIVRHALALAAAGIALGTAGALSLSYVMQTLLFDLESTDPATFMSVAGALCLVALLAACVPALRATRVDPLTALRTE